MISPAPPTLDFYGRPLAEGETVLTLFELIPEEGHARLRRSADSGRDPAFLICKELREQGWDASITAVELSNHSLEWPKIRITIHMKDGVLSKRP